MKYRRIKFKKDTIVIVGTAQTETTFVHVCDGARMNIVRTRGFVAESFPAIVTQEFVSPEWWQKFHATEPETASNPVALAGICEQIVDEVNAMSEREYVIDGKLKEGRIPCLSDGQRFYILWQNSHG